MKRLWGGGRGFSQADCQASFSGSANAPCNQAPRTETLPCFDGSEQGSSQSLDSGYDEPIPIEILDLVGDMCLVRRVRPTSWRVFSLWREETKRQSQKETRVERFPPYEQRVQATHGPRNSFLESGADRVRSLPSAHQPLGIWATLRRDSPVLKETRTARDSRVAQAVRSIEQRAAIPDHGPVAAAENPSTQRQRDRMRAARNRLKGPVPMDCS